MKFKGFPLNLQLDNTQKRLQETCLSIGEVLIEKNRRYGNSALKPLNIFSKLNAKEGIRQRLDDKLKRISNSTEHRKNDVFDIIGYLILYCEANDWINFEDQLD